MFFNLSSFSSVLAQDSSMWTPQQRIPGYEDNTWPPILIADRNRTVHAFSSQWLSGNEGPTVRAIMYNQWTLEQGWTIPVDIILPPFKNDARLLDAFLDQYGMVHIIFWGGDNTKANIYYSSAPITNAANAHAWSVPILVAENAQDPENGVFYTQDQNKLFILFSGNLEGNGLYTTSSTDRGITWSNPTLVFNTTDNNNFINNLKIFKSDSGWIHAIWNEVNPGGQGRGIFYSKKRIDDLEWSNPIKLAEAETGYGTNTPAIIEYHNTILAFYNLDGIIWQRLSNDVGETWTSPLQLFSHHVGVNGGLSLVVDSNDDLHLFFGQRIPGSPDIHGMWHSVYHGINWSEPEAVTSGPQITDLQGDKAFDPFEARAVVSQGNVILVTWRSDPGMKGNGVWYSDKILDAPELPVIAPETILLINTQIPGPTEALSSLLPTPLPDTTLLKNLPSGTTTSFQNNSPAKALLISIIPVFLLICLVLIKVFLAHHTRT